MSSMTIREKVVLAIRQTFAGGVRATNNQVATAAIVAFLEAATEEGWNMYPDEATVKMRVAASESILQPPTNGSRAQTTYNAMLAASPKFEWDK